MNQTQTYMDMPSSHMSSAQPYASQPATAGGMPHYSHYPQSAVLQPHSNYGPPSSSYASYGYSNGVTSPPHASQTVASSLSSQMGGQLLPLPAMNATPAPHAYSAAPGQGYPGQPFDTTGQIGPPNVKAGKVTATLWEDEGTLCFQIETNGICVARREDNHMINGTKLLNVAKMTRGRRDGILKSEKVRHVVKIGPMHLKGVWIPFERALEMANKEKITDKLYPLFVHNIAAISERRRADAPMQRPPTATQHPGVHHHHSLSGGVPQGHSLAPHQGNPRPGLDRAQTFPTPPTSASSIIGMGTQGSSYDWPPQNLGSTVSANNPLSIDTTLSGNRSVPSTPATTPPGTNMHSMQQYQSQPVYEKTYYTAAPSSQPQYATHPSMTPQSMTSKPESYHSSHANGQVSHASDEADQPHEHENGYINDTSNGYTPNRNSYTYSTGPSVGSIGQEHPHMPSDISGTSPHQNGSGRVTPRTTGNPPQWSSTYQTPPRTATNGMYSNMSDNRGPLTNGSGSVDQYGIPPTSAQTYTPMNGAGGSNKRMRDDDDQDRPDSRGPDAGFDLKRRKTLNDGPMGGPVGPPMPLPIKAGGGSRIRR